MSDKTTLCWRCSKPYPITDAECPHCSATNANVDFDKANKERGMGEHTEWQPIDSATAANRLSVLEREHAEFYAENQKLHLEIVRLLHRLKALDFFR